ncbi:MFS transporter [Deinococcus irradiatisoli]|uniref:MFS transporter n=1 Tax=Deinococcus irradiatisoli TaxID=2202254 RepID=UPI0011B23B5B|nr:MFS transporter [Deinococcus irradiatisoli]
MSTSEASRPWTAAQRWTLVATVLGSSMAFLDGSVVNVALNALQRDFRAELTSVQWVVNAYTLLLAALILTGGALGDLYGRKKMFGLGVLVFAAASLACGLAPNLPLLIAARSVQGLGGALLIPGSLALINTVFPGQSRGRAIGLWSSTTSLVTIFGPALGGLLVDAASWRVVFLINLPLAALVLFSLRPVPGDVPGRAHAGQRPDVLGSALVVLGLGALTYGLISGADRGLSGRPLLIAVAGVAVLAAFVLWEARSQAPMLPLTLFRSAAFSGTNLLTFLLYGALGAALFFLPLNLIAVQGYRAALAGAAFLPLSLMLAGLSGFFGALADRHGPRRLLTAGPALAGLGFIWLGNLGVGSSFWTAVLPGMLLLGLGMAVTVAPLTSAVMGSVDVAYSGAASGVNNAVSRAAGLIALAALTLLMLSHFRGVLEVQLQAAGLPEGARQAMLAQSSRLAQVPLPSGLGSDQAKLAADAVKSAFAEGFRWVCWVCGALALLSALTGGLSLRAGPPQT